MWELINFKKTLKKFINLKINFLDVIKDEIKVHMQIVQGGFIFFFKHTLSRYCLPKFSVGETADQSVITTQWPSTRTELHECERVTVISGACGSLGKARLQVKVRLGSLLLVSACVKAFCRSCCRLQRQRESVKVSGCLISCCPECTEVKGFNLKCSNRLISVWP